MGGGGQWPPYTFLNVDYDALHFHTGSLKINIFQSMLLGGREGGGHEKEFLIMLTILDDPLLTTANKFRHTNLSSKVYYILTYCRRVITGIGSHLTSLSGKLSSLGGGKLRNAL